MKKICLRTTKPLDYIDDLLRLYSEIDDINIDYAKNIINETNKLYKGQIDFGYAKNLQDKWYESLKTNSPDYSVYNDKYYFTDLICCWQMYSKNYLLSLEKNKLKKNNKSLKEEIGSVNRIFDLGCGLGLTTALLKQIYPSAEVIGTNLKNTKQYAFCKKLSEIFNFTVLDNNELNGKVDLIFASEYFEHIEDAISNIQTYLMTFKPKYLYLANSFNTVSVGHFKTYKYKGNAYHNDILYHETKASRAFNQQMKFLEYWPVATTNWNNKPSLWKKNVMVE